MHVAMHPQIHSASEHSVMGVVMHPQAELEVEELASRQVGAFRAKQRQLEIEQEMNAALSLPAFRTSA